MVGFVLFRMLKTFIHQYNINEHGIEWIILLYHHYTKVVNYCSMINSVIVWFPLHHYFTTSMQIVLDTPCYTFGGVQYSMFTAHHVHYIV